MPAGSDETTDRPQPIPRPWPKEENCIGNLLTLGWEQHFFKQGRPTCACRKYPTSVNDPPDGCTGAH